MLSEPNDLVEKIAMKIYEYDGGISPEEYEEIHGIKKKLWRIPWDESDLELAEWQRDDYRLQAKEVIKLLVSLEKLVE
jgi:hypothetical protein